MKKKRKLSLSSPLPVDCIGEIVHFLHLTTTFFKIYGLSQHVKWYLENENPETTEHIKFIGKKGVKVESEKKYVKWLRLHDEIPLKFFPRVKTLVIHFETLFRIERSRDISEDYFKILPSLRQLDNLIVECGVVTDGHLVHFSKLIKIVIKDSNVVTDTGLMNLEDVEDLDISVIRMFEPEPVVGNSFESLKNLRCLNVRGRKLIINSAIRCFPRLKELNISNNKYLTDDHLKLLTCVERLDISNCNITDKGLQNLPSSIKELTCYSNFGLTNTGMSRFKEIEVLKFPFFNTEVTEDVLKEFKEIRKLSIYAKRFLDNFRSIIKNTSPSLSEFIIMDPSGSITDDDMKLLAKFPNLQTLNIKWTGITDEGLKNIAHHCKNLRKLGIYYVMKITDEGLKQVNYVREVIVKKSAKRRFD